MKTTFSKTDIEMINNVYNEKYLELQKQFEADLQRLIRKYPPVENPVEGEKVGGEIIYHSEAYLIASEGRGMRMHILDYKNCSEDGKPEYHCMEVVNGITQIDKSLHRLNNLSITVDTTVFR